MKQNDIELKLRRISYNYKNKMHVQAFAESFDTIDR